MEVGLTEILPLVAFAPDQLPLVGEALAVQVPLPLFQASVVEAPGAIVVGLAPMKREAGGASWLAEPIVLGFPEFNPKHCQFAVPPAAGKAPPLLGFPAEH